MFRDLNLLFRKKKNTVYLYTVYNSRIEPKRMSKRVYIKRMVCSSGCFSCSCSVRQTASCDNADTADCESFLWASQGGQEGCLRGRLPLGCPSPHNELGNKDGRSQAWIRQKITYTKYIFLKQGLS